MSRYIKEKIDRVLSQFKILMIYKTEVKGKMSDKAKKYW